MEQLIEIISKTEPHEINDILHTVLDRYRELYPGWEISILSIERNEDRNKQLDEMIALLQNMKEK